MPLLHLLQELQSLTDLLQHTATLVPVLTQLLAVCSGEIAAAVLDEVQASHTHYIGTEDTLIMRIPKYEDLIMRKVAL